MKRRRRKARWNKWKDRAHVKRTPKQTQCVQAIKATKPALNTCTIRGLLEQRSKTRYLGSNVYGFGPEASTMKAWLLKGGNGHTQHTPRMASTCGISSSSGPLDVLAVLILGDSQNRRGQEQVMPFRPGPLRHFRLRWHLQRRQRVECGHLGGGAIASRIEEADAAGSSRI